MLTFSSLSFTFLLALACIRMTAMSQGVLLQQLNSHQTQFLQNNLGISTSTFMKYITLKSYFQPLYSEE